MAESVIKLHAKRGPSGAPRWAFCHASPEREAASPNKGGGSAADAGTVTHDLGEGVLKHGPAYLEQRKGMRGMVDEKGQTTYHAADDLFAAFGHLVDDEMVDCVERYVDHIKKVAMGGVLMVEQRLSIEHITGERGAKGTSDAVVLFPDEIFVGDLKGGYQRVLASYPLTGYRYEHAPDAIKRAMLLRDDVRMPNLQALMYAEAARHQYDADGTRFKRVRLSIIQPRLNHVDEHVMEIAEFRVWVQWVKEQAHLSHQPNARALVSESTCQWCRAFPCEDAKAAALQTALDDFEDAPRDISKIDLAEAARLVPVIRQFCDSVDAAVREQLTAGRPVAGFKIVEGDLGDRKWADDTAVRSTLAGIGLKPEQYLNSKTISPAQAEKLVIGKRASPNRVITKEQWESIQTLIAPRSVGAPKVVPDSDPRPPMATDHFGDDVSDFFN